jgi:hypothetical protein
MTEQEQISAKLTTPPVAVMSRAQLLLCSKEQQKRFSEYEKLGLLEIIDNDIDRPAKVVER